MQNLYTLTVHAIYFTNILNFFWSQLQQSLGKKIKNVTKQQQPKKMKTMKREAPNNRPLSHSGHFESQEKKKLCFCPSSFAIDKRLDGQNLFFQHWLIKVY